MQQINPEFTMLCCSPASPLFGFGSSCCSTQPVSASRHVNPPPLSPVSACRPRRCMDGRGRVTACEGLESLYSVHGCCSSSSSPIHPCHRCRPFSRRPAQLTGVYHKDFTAAAGHAIHPRGAAMQQTVVL